MIVQLAIIAAVLLAGGIIFSGELVQLLPESTEMFSTTMSDFNNMTNSSFETLNVQINSSLNDINTNLDQISQSSTIFLDENITQKIS